MHRVAQLIDELVASGLVPSISIAVRVDGALALHHVAGVARREPERRARLDEPYDLASVTKALAGATVAACLVGDGAVDLDGPVRRVLPDVPDGVTPRLLLQHAAGYPAWAPLYARFPASDWGNDETRTALMEAARRTPLQSAPGAAHCYSDLGFLTLLALLERVGGARLDALFTERVLRPTGLDLRWGWPGAAATEDCPVRGRVIEGRVHDLNADAMGGVSAHAGLFGTARDVAALGEALIDAAAGRRDDLPGPTIARFWADKGPGSHRCGWDGPTRGGYTSTGASWPDDGVGHLGYTGTSLWLAPGRRVVVALLTNRVHPVDDKEPIRRVRPQVHDAVARALGWDREPR